jgi:ribonuclease HI
MFTDSSFSKNLQRATWAVWLRANGTTFRHSGIVRGTVTQSGDGELAALANGLVACRSHFAPLARTKIIVQTDSQEAISAIMAKTHPRPYAQEIVNYIHTFWSAEGFRLDLRHVKGHQGTRNRRAAVNTWCDNECRRLMGHLLRERYEYHASTQPSAEVSP